MEMRLPVCACVCALLISGLAFRIQTAEPNPATERLTYDIEWRLIHAGTAVVEDNPASVHLKLESAGLVSTLFKINDTYQVAYQDLFCATSSSLDAQEGKRHHDTRITYDRAKNRAFFVERDVLADRVVRSSDVEMPNCVHDPIGALVRVRGMQIPLGQSVQLPVTDGRKTAQMKVEAQEREDIKTAAGSFKTMRYEAGLLNGVVYPRKGRVLVWISEDPRRLPVRIQLRMTFPLGTVTLDLRKADRL